MVLSKTLAPSNGTFPGVDLRGKREPDVSGRTGAVSSGFFGGDLTIEAHRSKYRNKDVVLRLKMRLTLKTSESGYQSVC